MGDSIRAAVVQLNSTEDRDRNLERADTLVRAAAGRGAQLIVLPEKWNVLGRADAMEAAAQPLGGPALRWARDLAQELEIDLVAGSIVERRPGQERTSNTSAHLDSTGQMQAVYRKLHMFDVEVDGVV